MNLQVLVNTLEPLLVDEISVSTYKGESPSHVAVYGEEKVIKKVKVDFSENVTRETKGENKKVNMNIFTYTGLSTSNTYTLKDKIIFKEKEYTVTAINHTVIGVELEVVENG